MISDIYKEDKKVKIRWKYCSFRLMTLYIGYGTKNVVVIKEWKLSIDLLCGATSKEQGWRTVVRALASHQSQWPKFKSWRRRHMWFEFIFGFLSCSKGFSPGTPVFPSSQKPMQLFQIPIRSGTHGHVSTCQHITIYHRNYGLLLNLQLLQICHV